MLLKPTLKRRLKTIIKFIYISPAGLIVIIIIISQISYLQQEIHDALEILENPENQTYFSSGIHIDRLVLIMTLGATIYLLLTLVTLIIQRTKFLSNNENLRIETAGDKILLKTDKQTTFQIIAELQAVNITQKPKKKKQLEIIQAKLENKQFIFNISKLQVGRYKIKEIKFIIKEPLDLLGTIFYYKPPHPIKFTKAPTITHKKRNTLNYSLTQVNKSAFTYNTPIDEYYDTREYQRGDPLKRVHWKNSAKTGDLIVRKPERNLIKPKIYRIFLNLYSPYLKEIDQRNIISNYLKKAINQIISLKREGETEIYLNSYKPTTIKVADEYSDEELTGLILKKSIFQEKTPFIETSKNLQHNFIISMSTDKIPPNPKFKRKVFIYPASQNYPLTFLDKFKTDFKNTLTDNETRIHKNFLQFIGLYGQLEIINPKTNQQFRKIIKENEDYYHKMKHTKLL